MDFIDKISELSAKIQKTVDHIQTEEATKNAWVLPFISALGYDVFDPTEVVPEFTADVGTKKGEKVDYAIFRDGMPIILFECKCHGCDLDVQHASQLFRYFTVTKARFAVLTNGIIYRFFTDLEEANKMDSKPFLEFNMLEIKESLVEELKKFTKSVFDVDQILATASELKYTKEVKRVMAEQIANPSEDFVRVFTSQIYSGRMTPAVKQQFTEIVKRALQQFISDRISDRLKFALAEESTSAAAEQIQEVQEVNGKEEPNGDKQIVTTDDEIESYFIVKSILRETCDAKRIHMRDVASYCSILLDNNNRKPICRLRFTANKKAIGLIDDQKQEQIVPIESLDDIYQHAETLKAAVAMHER